MWVWRRILNICWIERISNIEVLENKRGKELDCTYKETTKELDRSHTKRTDEMDFGRKM